MNGDKLMDSMKNKDTYMFCYYESKEAAEDMNQKNILFAFNIVGDGEVMIIHQWKISSLNTPLVSTEVHGKLLKKLKGILGIDF
ncbi:hypothetical protein LCL96_08065 [Rossellomorea aquimaris]|uniref:hypothetical protein n=1 Tax=Rossellomorea aquimaris TaxID=189382 RepID=UPI001CD27165|nr:hypothetical protein [Rossellomorea aquimaris]MCA1058886.1 hypothetical protein [Rossellomorea aquimaris]